MHFGPWGWYTGDGTLGLLAMLLMMLVPLALLALAVVGVIWAANRSSSGPAGSERRAGRSPLDIVRERYARGEMSREDYLRLREELGPPGTPEPPPPTM